jgi:hypothetical protein
MILIAMAVKDRAIGSFNRPFFVPSIPMAVRSFTDEVNRVAPDNQMAAHPEDFELWYLGNFNEDSGVFGVLDPDGLRVVSRAQDVVKVL